MARWHAVSLAIPLLLVHTLLQTNFNERYGTISPNGRWVAYQSDETGREEIYVRPFPNTDGGRWQGTEQQRLLLLRTAIAEGVEYVDIEDDIAGSIPRFGKTKRIVSFHSFRNTPDNLRELHDRLKSKDADIVKIATMANQPRDNVRVLEMMQESDVPTIGMCMGDIGTPSRILAGKFSAPFTYATFHHERALAPGSIPA